MIARPAAPAQIASGEPRTVLSRSGAEIDTSGPVWVLSPDEAVAWEPMYDAAPDHLVYAAQEYVRHLVRNASATHAFKESACLLQTLRAVRDLVGGLGPADDIGAAVFTAADGRLRETLTHSSHTRYLGAYRRWYIWCADAGLDGFDDDVATDLEERSFGRSPKGAAVLSHDPDRGPLNTVEFAALLSKLRSPAAAAMPLEQIAALWLFVAFGTNAKNMRLLHEDDLLKTVLADGTAVYELRIPRIKKRTSGERDQFRIRPLDPVIGALLEQLIAANATVRAADSVWDDARFDRLLFARPTRAERLVGTPFERNAYRQEARYLMQLLLDVSDVLDLRAFPSGGRLHLTVRRLRYTFATRLVQSGASPLEVADALDHTDIDNVMVYFNARSDIVARLDEKLARHLAPYAQAFLGQIIRAEKDATRANDPASRVRLFDREARRLETVGSCGSFGYCGLFAPIACYTCPLFQPWLDGPHDAVLADLVRRRERNLERGADPKFTQMHDLTIYAVAEVVERCRCIRGEAISEEAVA